MPELFGLYSLALATVFIFIGFTDMGIDSALIKYVSGFLGEENRKKAKQYLSYLFKLRTFLVFVIFMILLISAKFIAENYYNKPIFWALIVGSFYLLFLSFTNFFESLFFSVNKFKETFYKEIIFQISRLVLTLIVVLVLTKQGLSNMLLLSLIMICLVLASFSALIFLLFKSKKGISFLQIKSKKISKSEKKEVNKFILPLTTTVLSGLFLSYVDIIMLGGFIIDSEFIGYYSAAFHLTGAAASLLAFSTVLFPIFSRLRGKRLKRGLTKTIKVVLPITIALSILIVFLTMIFSPLIIKIIYGGGYSNSINLLRILSLSIITGPIIAIYTNYFISKGNTKIIAKLLILTTLLNICLNYILISIFIKQSHFLATIGAAIATIFSGFVYLTSLVISAKSK